MTLAKPVAIYFKLVAAAVAIHFCISAFYGNAEDAEFTSTDVWYVIDWFIAAALALALVTTWQRRAASAASDRSARHMFLAAVIVTLAFVPNWFDFLMDNDSNADIWYLLDIAVPVLLWTEGHRLWKA